MKKRREGFRTGYDRLWLSPALIAFIALTGCGGDDEPDPVEPEPDPPRAAAISISPTTVTLTSAGETATFTAAITDQFGAPFSGAATWASSDADVFTVNSSGVVTAVANGSGTVTAALDNLSATASVSVDIPAATAIAIEPDSVTLTSVGDTSTFTASITDQHGAPFSATVTWSSSDTDVFTVSSSGVVTAVADGSGTVTAALEDLSATAAVTVDINLPPVVREGVREGLVVPMAARGGPRPWVAASRFEDPDDDVLDLTYTVEVEDTTLAWAEVVMGSERKPIVVMSGKAPGRTTLTTTATDPGGLSASVSIILDVNDSDFSPLGILRVANTTIDVGGRTLLEDCSPPYMDAVHAAGFTFTVNSSRWQTRSDSATAWSDIEGTEMTDGTMCTHSTTAAGEYRLVLTITLTFGAARDPIVGQYRSGDTFVVEDSGDANRAPQLSPTAPQDMHLGVGGGSDFVAPAAQIVDPDGDDLEFTVSVSDSTVFSVEIVADNLGRSAVFATGDAPGEGTLTITGTDPEGLSAELRLAVVVDDSGYTRGTLFRVDNGLINLLGTQLTGCTPPIIDQPITDETSLTIHSSKWQSRSDSTAAWADIEGTEVTDGTLCAYTAEAPGDYRLVYNLTVTAIFSPGAPPLAGNYSSRNFFTVAGGG